MRRPGNNRVLSALALGIVGVAATSGAARIGTPTGSASETVAGSATVTTKVAPSAGEQQIAFVQPEILLDRPIAAARSTPRSRASASAVASRTIAPSVLSSSPGVRLAGSDHDPELGERRYFNGRPIRAVKTVRMRVTAYSPDHRSCGIHADGITASGYSVEANGGRLVAADRRLFPFGSLLTVPGYAGGQVVPVLDRGGAIKGSRLDVLYPTHDIARRWGVRHLDVTVWEYADGRPIGYRRPRGR